MNAVTPAIARQHAAGVRIRGLTRRFGGPAVLDRLDLDIRPGEFLALLGRSGSGKTTLLRTLAGLDPVEQGEVAAPARRAVVFQDPRLLPWKRVLRNVTLGLRGADPKGRALAALAEVGLAHRTDAWPLTLSGGEAQRAGLARALVREPELLLLDEPFAALDALTRLRMQAMVADLWQRHRCTVLLVTHDVDEAVLLADRAVVLEAGRIATEVAIPLERPRRHAGAEFAALRARLLNALGVEEDGHALAA
ncbi:ABC transporter ATP-binding protein [Roseomonas sp. NAR14]|uniref:ABC transporter ATP-binding protein n=1 Tax=Roseomonas acroporae TaxID=2937791 RepID=A0A9X2BXK7_9PROT|nr:ABC transporter ATP-binding protein [Roseomonas acroporae]MCK8787346.1 ABC transporter ATP-binding protein [Roseomonas acroporae]